MDDRSFPCEYICSINKIYIIKHFQKYEMIPKGKSAFSIISRDWLYRHYKQMMLWYIIVFAAYVYEHLLGTTCVMITSLSHLQYLSYKLCLFFYFFCDLLKYILKIHNNKENIYKEICLSQCKQTYSLYFMPFGQLIM